MTTIHYSGTDLFMGAGLICREPGVYTVEDVTAEILLANEPELFSLAEEQSQASEASQSDAVPPTEDELADGAPEKPEATSDTVTAEETEPGDDPATAEVTETETEPKTKPVSKMNKTELEALAAEVGADVNGEMTADEMREAIKAAQAE